MKKLFAMLATAAMIYACGGGDTKSESEPKADTSAATSEPAPAPAAGATGGIDAEKALTLIGSNDCTTCHAIDKKVIGPAYKDVAKKYEDNQATEDTLISKVKHGGSGNWGNIAMTPHPNLSD